MGHNIRMGYLGYVECDECGKYTYINKPEEVKIWFHPDDAKALAEVDCVNCGVTVESKISFDHVQNFKRRGCTIMGLNDRYAPLTEEFIDEWDIDGELTIADF